MSHGTTFVGHVKTFVMVKVGKDHGPQNINWMESLLAYTIE